MEALFSYCQYYKGETKNPFEKNDTNSLLWEYEYLWCEMQRKRDAAINEIVNEYNIAGLDEFEQYDNTPISLKAFLFNRYCYWCSGAMYDCVEPFKTWYKETYKKTGK